MYHRVPADGDGAELVRALLELLDVDDALIALDRERAITALAGRARAGSADAEGEAARSLSTALTRELAEIVVAELGGRGYEAVLYVGPAPAEMLQAIGPRTRRAVGISESRHEVQKARAGLHRAACRTASCSTAI